MNSMRSNAVLWSVLIIGVALVSCGRPKAERVVIVDPTATSVAGGSSAVTFGFIGGVFQPELCEEDVVFVFRADATACGRSGKAGHAYQVDKEMKFKDIGSVDLNKSDAEIAESFGIKEPKSLKKIGFAYPH